MTTVVESIEGYYEVQNVKFGTVYKWCPESVVVECDCGKRQPFTSSETVCDRCGENHAAEVREDLDTGWLEDEDAHPWRYIQEREGAEKLPF